MAKILFLSHRAPFPPDKGDKIRAFHMLRHLARHHEVWFGAGADDVGASQRPDVTDFPFRDACIAPLGPFRRGWNMVGGLAAGAPLSVSRFRHRRLERWIQHVLTDVRPDVVFIYSSAMAQYVIGRTAPGTRLIIDFVDADAEKWRAYAAAARFPMTAVFAREARRLTMFERRALDAAEAGIVISDTERRLLSAQIPSGAGKLRVLSNGVDLDYFSPAPGRGDGRSIVFCGRMDYQANADGAAWFAREVFPKVLASRPDATFRIVGACPTPAVRALGALPGVEVTGATPDVRPYLREAAVVVAPLRIARGIQNKVLEAMASARPIVVTPAALDGIDAADDYEVLVGADADGFARAVLDVLTGRTMPWLGENGRRFVELRHQWSTQLLALDRLIDNEDDRLSAEAAA
ncbi:TIGR03087 family PEP-CTERM/XrtA system glycosyltransferase [Caulobacter segnis]